MSNFYARAGSRGSTPPSEPIPGREDDQVKNAAGGYVFKLDPWDQLDRFLILGTEGGTYYVQEQKLTRQALAGVEALIRTDGPRVVSRVVEISKAGRAPRNTPAIWALAACSVLGDEATKAAANAVLGEVCRIGTHLFQWAECLRELKGGNLALGAGQRRAVRRWYDRDADTVAYQLLKYQQRGGISHRDMLRLAKPGSAQTGGKLESPELCAALGFAAGDQLAEPMPSQIVAFQAIRGEGVTAKMVAQRIRDHRLTREMIPSEWLREIEVWEALLESMPMNAMVRNLGKMASIGLLKPLSNAETFVAARLGSEEAIRKARLHPATLVNALKIYASGAGLRGDLTWAPTSHIKAALDGAVDLAFADLEPSNKRMLIAIDASGSMTWSGARCAGLEALRAVEGAAVMAMATARVEPVHHIIAFDHQVQEVPITAKSSLAEVVGCFGRGGYTDASLPMEYALKNRLEVDAFCIYTDNETWSGTFHPVQALKRYRRETGLSSRLIVIGMEGNGYTFGDPSDPLTLDVVGFDANAPAIISDFCAGESE